MNLQKWNALKVKIYNPRINEIATSTFCFFTENEKFESMPVGCGLFLKLNNDYYVASAAHVLAEFLDTTYIIINDIAITIGGISISSPLPKSGLRKDDKIDITVIKIDESILPLILTNYNPIDLAKIDLPHFLDDSPSYFLYGYPLSRTEKIRGKEEIKSKGYAFQTQPIIAFDYLKYGFDDKKHFAMAFEGKATNASNPNEHRTPDLTGISGSGLWQLNEKNKKSLIGIVIERINVPGNKAIISTNIEIVLSIIDKLSKS